MGHLIRVIRLLLSNKNVRVWLWLAASCLFLGGFLIISSEVQEAAGDSQELVSKIDALPREYLLNMRGPRLNGVAVDLTALGSSSVVVIFTLFASLLMYFRKRYSQILQLLAAVVGASVLTSIMKFYFERSRPDLLERLVHVDGYSYPSGHSLVGASLYFTFAILLCQEFKAFYERVLIVGFSFLFIFAIAFSRVYLGVHYISDVVAGVLLGIGWASLAGGVSAFLNTKYVLALRKIQLDLKKGSS